MFGSPLFRGKITTKITLQSRAPFRPFYILELMFHEISLVTTGEFKEHLDILAPWATIYPGGLRQAASQRRSVLHLRWEGTCLTLRGRCALGVSIYQGTLFIPPFTEEKFHENLKKSRGFRGPFQESIDGPLWPGLYFTDPLWPGRTIEVLKSSR